MVHELDARPVGIEQERAVVVLAVLRARPGRAVVAVPVLCSIPSVLSSVP
ncbi:MAG TPA: hypothetical protein VIL56_03095 [Gaiellaceae bacterium]